MVRASSNEVIAIYNVSNYQFVRIKVMKKSGKSTISEGLAVNVKKHL